jgi:hypothetical protein
VKLTHAHRSVMFAISEASGGVPCTIRGSLHSADNGSRVLYNIELVLLYVCGVQHMGEHKTLFVHRLFCTLFPEDVRVFVEANRIALAASSNGCSQDRWAGGWQFDGPLRVRCAAGTTLRTIAQRPL